MNTRRGSRFCVLCSLLYVTLGNIPLAHATTITVLSQNYSISGGTMKNSFNHSSSSPVTASLDDGNFGRVLAMADGAVGASTGFLSALVDVSVFGGAHASSTLDFRLSASDSINLTTSGRYFGVAVASIRLLDVTNNVVLLDYKGRPVDPGFPDIWTLEGSFSFALDPSKDYRLQTFADVSGPDASRAGVEFRPASLPEPASLWPLLLSLPALAIPRKGPKK